MAQIAAVMGVAGGQQATCPGLRAGTQSPPRPLGLGPRSESTHVRSPSSNVTISNLTPQPVESVRWTQELQCGCGTVSSQVLSHQVPWAGQGPGKGIHCRGPGPCRQLAHTSLSLLPCSLGGAVTLILTCPGPRSRPSHHRVTTLHQGLWPCVPHVQDPKVQFRSSPTPVPTGDLTAPEL